VGNYEGQERGKGRHKIGGGKFTPCKSRENPAQS